MKVINTCNTRNCASDILLTLILFKIVALKIVYYLVQQLLDVKTLTILKIS